MKAIKSYSETFKELFTEPNYYNRSSRVKRSLFRLEQNLETSGRARTTLKQYVKIKNSTAPVKTRSRDLIVFDFMIDKLIKVYNGKSYIPIKINKESLGRYLGEFVPTRVNGGPPKSAQTKKKKKNAT